MMGEILEKKFMNDTFNVNITGWENGRDIPTKFAFGKQSVAEHVALSDNLNPAISWSNAPEGTKSFAIICHDPDVPSSAEDVNQEGKTVPADLQRLDFYHWVLVDVPANVSNIPEGAASSGVTPKGKEVGKKSYGIAGINSYTDWFAGDADMGGFYGDYDGPCPPWNDSIIHHYHFTVYALDTLSLGLTGNFTGSDTVEALQGHILAQNSFVGTYTLNPNI
ncbi:MAG: Raf kinase inhibitor-like YbhB/YbcL family protein [Cocleimonas sp.]|jgi:Raf kinase inhibitor-like YbhB/YbcL family protein